MVSRQASKQASEKASRRCSENVQSTLSKFGKYVTTRIYNNIFVQDQVSR